MRGDLAVKTPRASSVWSFCKKAGNAVVLVFYWALVAVGVVVGLGLYVAFAVIPWLPAIVVFAVLVEVSAQLLVLAVPALSVTTASFITAPAIGVAIVWLLSRQSDAEQKKRLEKEQRKKLQAKNYFAQVLDSKVQPDNLPMILFLRSYRQDQFVGSDDSYTGPASDSDGGKLYDIKDDLPTRRKKWELEGEISGTVENHAIFLAVGNDDYASGAVRITSSQERWQSDVEKLMQAARVIICVPGMSSGTGWEIDTIFGRDFLHKTIFVNFGNFIVQKKGGKDFSSELISSELSQDGSYFKTPQWLLWEGMRKRFGFPKFAPYGGYFMMLKQGQPLDSQAWSTSPGLALLTLLERQKLFSLPAEGSRHIA